MTAAEVPAFILELAQKAATASGAKAVYLFGSYARGEAKPDSDVDLLLLMDDNANLHDSSIAAYRANRTRKIGVDFIAMHQTTYLQRQAILAHEVAKEGILLLEHTNAQAIFKNQHSSFLADFVKRYQAEVIRG